MGARAQVTARELVIVTVSGRRCAVWARHVDEVAPMVEVSSLPGAPTVVEGLVDAHGEIIPVLDLSVRFGASNQAPRLDHRLVIVNTGSRRVGLHVEHDIELVTPTDGELRTTDVPEAPQAAGVVLLPDGIVLIYDVEAFLSSEEVVALDVTMARQHEVDG